MKGSKVEAGVEERRHVRSEIGENRFTFCIPRFLDCIDYTALFFSAVYVMDETRKITTPVRKLMCSEEENEGIRLLEVIEFLSD